MSLERADAPRREEAGPDVPHRVDELAPRPDEEAPAAGGSEAQPGHPVRDRLLARAREAAQLRGVAEQSSSGLGDEGDLLGSFTDELDRVGKRRRAPSAPPIVDGRRDLPPNLIALFATLLGLALLTALFAVLSRLSPRDGTPAARLETKAPPVVSATQPTPPPAAERAAKPTRPPRARVPGPWRIADASGPEGRKVEGTVGRTSFLKAIQEAGVPMAQGYRLLKVMQGLRDLDHCNPRDRFQALLERGAGRVLAFEYIVSREEVYQAREGDDGLLRATKLDLKVERNRVQGAVIFYRESISASIEAGGFEASLAAVLDDALEGHGSVAGLARGDRLRVVAQEVTVLGEFARYAGIEALELVSAEGDGKPLRIYYFQGPRSRGYYDAIGRSVHEGGWRRPIKGAPITSRFNPKRLHPILKKVMPHNGTDFGAPTGTPIGSVGAGTVKFVGYAGANGNFVSIDHAGGIESGYSHLSRFESGLKVGDRVKPTQVIGYVGSTGRSTGPHLHFSIKKNGVFVDAESLKFDALRVLPQGELAEFMEARSHLDALLDAIKLPPEADRTSPAPPASTPSARAEELDMEGEPGAGDPASEEDDPGLEADPEEPSGAEAETPRNETVAAPEAPPRPAAPPGQPQARPPPGGSLYLSDKELMRTQPATDDGEVDE